MLLQHLDTSNDTVGSSKHKVGFQVGTLSLTLVESRESTKKHLSNLISIIDLTNLPLALKSLRVA